MNAKLLSKVIEVENRVNTICKCLVLGEADHFEVHYTSTQVSIMAYTHNVQVNKKLTDLMRIYAEPTDKVEEQVFEGKIGNFWTSEMTISL